MTTLVYDNGNQAILLQSKLQHYYSVLEMELDKKGLTVPNIPMNSEEEMVLILQKMILDQRGFL